MFQARRVFGTAYLTRNVGRVDLSTEMGRIRDFNVSFKLRPNCV